MTQTRPTSEEYRQKERERAKRNRQKQKEERTYSTYSKGDSVRTDEEIEVLANKYETKRIQTGPPDPEKMKNGFVGRTTTKAVAVLQEDDPDLAEPIRVVTFSKPEEARELVMRYLMKLKARGWKVVEIQARYIS